MEEKHLAVQGRLLALLRQHERRVGLPLARHWLEFILESDSAQKRSLISERISSSWSDDQYKLAVEAMLK